MLRNNYTIWPCSRTAFLFSALFLLVAVNAFAGIDRFARIVAPTFTKSFTPSNIGPGSVSTLRFRITNADTLPIRNIAFTDSLPAGMTIASPANLAITCLGTVDASSGGATVALSGGSVGGASTCTITVDVTAAAPGTYSNISGDLTSDAGNSFSPSAVAFGGRSTLTFTIDNSANASNRGSLSFIRFAVKPRPSGRGGCQARYPLPRYLCRSHRPALFFRHRQALGLSLHSTGIYFNAA